MKVLRFSNPLFAWRAFFNGVEILDGNWCDADEEAGTIVRFKILAEKPDMPERETYTENGRLCLRVNYFEKFGGYFLTEDSYETLSGSVRLQMRTEAEIRQMVRR